MKLMLAILTTLFFVVTGYSQQRVAETENDINANQLEELAEDEEGETENDYDLQQLNYFTRHPLDINGPDLGQLPLIDPLLLTNLKVYRQLLGDIIDLHELQAVPGFTVATIKSILPYVTLNKEKLSLPDLRERFIKGEHSVLIRPSIVPEISHGFRSSSDQHFLGSRAAILLRYKYTFRNLLQFGFVAEKDAGEQLLTHGTMPDFTSFHLFARKIGLIKCVALGDFTVNMGQGLIHWQSQAFRKSSSVISIKRQSEVLRPYHSAGEYNFHRGVAATVAVHSSEITFFVSRKALTANIDGNAITSVITSGLHRTTAELNDRNSAYFLTTGASVKQKLTSGHVGLNCVYHRYSLPVMKRDESYNLYALKGRESKNISVDYSYTYRNLHLFGECATDRLWSFAYIHGVMASLSQSVDLAILFRSISKSYQSVFGNAFTENTMPVNERGFYSGISIKPHLKWRIDLYADMFSFPWLKYRLDAPSSGFAYLIQLTWKPNKQTEIYSRFRYRLKPLNIEGEEDANTPGIQSIQNWRTHFSYQASASILLRSRVEVCVFSHQFLSNPATGYLFYTDVVYKPKRSWLSGNVRLQAFEAENYDTRIYAYENDLLFVSSTPSFYNNGVRYYMNISVKIKAKILSNSVLLLNLKLASTVYNNISHVGTGPSLIPGNRVSSVKLQIFLSR
jgi:hypothetical protein